VILRTPEEFPIYLLFSKKGQGIGEKEGGGEVVRTVIIVIIFLRLISSIFDNWENDLPYSAYVIVVISV